MPNKVGKKVMLSGLSDYGHSILERVGRFYTVLEYRSDACIDEEIVPAYRVQSEEGSARWIKRDNDPNFKILFARENETE
jgi:hypothetical protein